MPWRDSLLKLKDDLAAVRATRSERLEALDRQTAAEREELLSMQQSLGIAELIDDMNDVLLDGRGEIETTVEWEADDDEELLEGEDDLADVISTTLTWDEGEELEVVVELVMLDDGLSLLVNGVQIRRDREALERALLSAFREQLEI